MAILAASRLSDGGGPSKFVPAAVVVTQNGEQVKIDSRGRSADGNVPVGSTKPLESTTVFTPVATIVTQNGEEIEVDSFGRSITGGVPVGATKTTPTPTPTPTPSKKVVSTFTDPTSGDVIAVYEDGSQSTLSKGTNALTAQRKAEADLSAKRAAGQSAYDLLNDQFSKMGLGSLVEPLKNLIITGASPAEFTIKLRETPAYQKRFAANAERIKKGLTAIDESTYLGLEDSYQTIMRNYGLPESYWTRGELGVQEGFTKLIANNVNSVDLENRIMTAQDRVLKANPEVLNTLKQFYPGITNGDILAYSLDPANAIKDIQRKVTNAEIGGAAVAAGLNLGTTPEQIAASQARAEMLQGYGVTKAAATSGFQTVADFGRGSELAGFYNRPTYGQMEAEQEVFKLEGATAARKKRSEITGLEKAAFGGKTGLTGGALERDRAGGY
jgi:hypothetical protein